MTFGALGHFEAVRPIAHPLCNNWPVYLAARLHNDQPLFTITDLMKAAAYWATKNKYRITFQRIVTVTSRPSPSISSLVHRHRPHAQTPAGFSMQEGPVEQADDWQCGRQHGAWSARIQVVSRSSTWCNARLGRTKTAYQQGSVWEGAFEHHSWDSRPANEKNTRKLAKGMGVPGRNTHVICAAPWATGVVCRGGGVCDSTHSSVATQQPMFSFWRVR